MSVLGLLYMNLQLCRYQSQGTVSAVTLQEIGVMWSSLECSAPKHVTRRDGAPVCRIQESLHIVMLPIDSM